MNSNNLILRQTDYPPLVNKDDFLDNADFDSNMINIYDDLLALCLTNGVIAYDISTEYDDAVINYATYSSKLWKFVNAIPASNVTPGTNELYWLEVFPTEMAHRKNSDTILDEGGTNEVTASEIRAFIDAGLTSTTNLSLSEQGTNSLKINSSTGSDVILIGATETTAGLLNSSDKQKLNQLSGINSGDQTLESLGAEATANKVTDFSTVDNTTFPTTEAVNVQINDLVPTLVDEVMTGYQKTTSSTALTFMFSGTNSGISTYKKAFDLANFIAGASANNGGVSTSTTPTLQVVFATEPNKPNLTVIPIGNVLCHFETQKSSGGNSYYSYVNIYKRNLAGTETLILTSDNSTSTASNDVIQNTVSIQNSSIITLDVTDRLVFKIYSVMVSGTATITSIFDDATMARVEMPYTIDLTTYATKAYTDESLATKENTSNKSDNTADYASTVKFPVWSAIVSYFSAVKIRSILGVTTLSGSNTGDQDLSAYQLVLTSIVEYTASQILALSDSGKLVIMNVGSANNLDVPPNVDVAFPVGTQISVVQNGAGKTRIRPGVGVTLNSDTSKTYIASQYSGCTLIKTATNTWSLIGNLSAS